MAKINPELADLVGPIADLREYPNNPRVHDVPVIAESLRVNGQYRPIVVRRHDDPEKDQTILAGHGTVKAARSLGWEEIARTYVEVDDQTAARIVAVDNRASDLAGMNDELLTRVLQEAGDLSGSGYSQADLDKLLDGLVPKPDQLPELEFSLMVGERHNYVVLTFDNDVDWAAALEVLNVPTVKAWDARPGYSRAGVGRVLDGAPIVRRLVGGE